ncbi:unnamed protein product [Ceutorhynchus assimilis]|uniref:AMP-dependent synthetase/ligase domain-containing protein n=1 Tax=Ceutorhynchus assimilis TaxID=467358 RepID=A0A9P0DCY1_9CUCU|nr:unnamed protein product [Ceutorhynchus assimilis]
MEIDDIIQDKATKTISSSSNNYNQTYRGLGYEFFESMQQNKDKIAQYIAETGETDTYQSFLNRSIRTALHLKTRNLNKNDVVCLCSYNQKHNCIPLIACTFLGIPTASLDPSFTINDASHLIKLIKPKIFFIVPEVIDMITEAMQIAELDSEVVIYGDTEKFTSFNDFLAEHPEEDSFRPVIIDDLSETAIIFFSSGTTGLPKGICSNHRAIYHQGVIMNHLGILGNDAVVLLFSTLYWISALLTLTGCILKGSARLVCKEFDPIKTWYLLDKYKITYTFLAPIQAYRMLTIGRPDGIDTTSLNLVITGGAHFASEQLHKFRDLLPGTFVSQAYGCTELSGFGIAFNLTKTKDRLLLHYKPESCGRPIPGLQYKIQILTTIAASTSVES